MRQGGIKIKIKIKIKMGGGEIAVDWTRTQFAFGVRVPSGTALNAAPLRVCVSRVERQGGVRQGGRI